MFDELGDKTDNHDCPQIIGIAVNREQSLRLLDRGFTVLKMFASFWCHAEAQPYKSLSTRSALDLSVRGSMDCSPAF